MAIITTQKHGNPLLVMRSHCDAFINALDADAPVESICRKIMMEIKNSELPVGLSLGAERLNDGMYDNFDALILDNSVHHLVQDEKHQFLWTRLFWLLTDNTKSDQALKIMKSIIKSPDALQKIIEMKYMHSQVLIPAICQFLAHVWPMDAVYVNPYIDVVLHRLFGSINIFHLKNRTIINNIIKYIHPSEAGNIHDFLVLLVQNDYINGDKAAKVVRKSGLFNDVTFLTSANDHRQHMHLNQKEAAKWFGVSVMTLIRYRKSGSIPEDYIRAEGSKVLYDIHRCTGINGLKKFIEHQG